MIYECTNGHICFSKEEDLCICAMKDCRKPTLIISPIDIEWFYKINDSGLCINRKDLSDNLFSLRRKKEGNDIF
jgi:hypothetical protein